MGDTSESAFLDAARRDVAAAAPLRVEAFAGDAVVTALPFRSSILDFRPYILVRGMRLED